MDKHTYFICTRAVCYSASHVFGRCASVWNEPNKREYCKAKLTMAHSGTRPTDHTDIWSKCVRGIAIYSLPVKLSASNRAQFCILISRGSFVYNHMAGIEWWTPWGWMLQHDQYTLSKLTDVSDNLLAPTGVHVFDVKEMTTGGLFCSSILPVSVLEHHGWLKPMFSLQSAE